MANVRRFFLSVGISWQLIAGGPGFSIGRGLTEAVTGIGDLVPEALLRWNFGVNNFMTYITGNLTMGLYDPTRIANLGIGHNAIDAGGAYTYFDQKTGREFSATLGFTYNFENEHTQYQNGVDMHLDWGASQFPRPRVATRLPKLDLRARGLTRFAPSGGFVFARLLATSRIGLFFQFVAAEHEFGERQFPTIHAGHFNSLTLLAIPHMKAKPVRFALNI
jgi:hypothetical protein